MSRRSEATRWPPTRPTDLGNAELFAMEHADTLKFVPGIGWLGYDGTRWKRDDDGRAARCARATVCTLWERARQIADTDKRKQAYKHAIHSESARAQAAMVRLALSDEKLIVRVDQLDTDPFLLAVANGTMDLRTGQLRAHRREDYITRLAPVEYDAAGTCPTWLAFLARIFDADDELIPYVQRCVGYTLTGDIREQVLFIPHGDGANGKSVFVETLAALLGEHAASADAATFTANRGWGIPNDLARLRGVRFVRATETEEGVTLARQLVKRVTGGDTVAARFLYGEWFEFTPAFKLWLVTNHLPAIPGEDRATWRRIRVVPFKVRIRPDEQDRQLLAKLRAERPGILNWALDGCLEWQRDGLGMPDAVADASADYRTEQDTVERFLSECCHASADATVGLTVLRGAYEAFCRKERVPPVTTRAWPKALSDRGFTQGKTGPRGRYWIGLELAQ
jgi:putative DNA primase/helicase